MRLRHGAAQFIEDVRLLKHGVLDLGSLCSGYRARPDPVEWIVRSPHPDGTPCHPHNDGTACGPSCMRCSCRSRGRIKAIRRQHNLRTKPATTIQGGTNQQANAMGLVYANTAASVVANSGASVTYTATTLTDTSQAWTVNQWTGSIVISGSVFGVVVSNTATVLTVDKWHNPVSTDTTGTTPAANAAFFIVAGAAPAHYIALSNDATAPAATDTTLAGEITTNGLARAIGTFTYTDATPSYTIAHTFTATGTQAAQKAGLFDASTGGVMWFENNAWTSVSMVSGDTLAFSWVISI